MKEKKYLRSADAQKVYENVERILPKGPHWDVRIAVAGDYFKLYKDGEPFLDDSANEDSYSIDGMISWIESYFLN